MRFAVPALLLSLAFCSPALPAQAPARFAAYEHCKFADDLSLVENTALASGVQGRTVKTIMGTRQVPLAGGRTLVFGYPRTEPFATVKVEQIPTADYPQARQDLIANFEQILTADDTSTRNYALKPRLNGLEIYGLDRKTLDGGVLGIYLFFVDRTHTAATIYFLNQDASVRSFQNLSEYAGLRDTFVGAFTRCAAGLPRGRQTVVQASPAATPEHTRLEASTTAALPDAPSAPASPAAPPSPRESGTAAAVSAVPSPETPSEPAHSAAGTAAHPAAVATARTTAKPSAPYAARSSKATKTSKRVSEARSASRASKVSRAVPSSKAAGKTAKPPARKKKP